MRRSRTSTRLAPLLFAAFLISATITSLPVPVRAVAEAEQLSEEEIAEAAVLADEAGEAEAGAEEEIEEEYVDEKDVLVLTDGNFSDAIKTHPFILVEFYAPWCGHCQALKPQYAKAATELKEAGLTVALGKVDATAEPSLGQKYAVQGYPTLKWFVDGEALDYGGGRTAEDIVKWIKKKTGPPATTVGSTAELEKVSGSVKTFALGYFSTLGSDGHKAFEDAARSADEIDFLQTTDAAVAKAAGLTAEGIVVSRTFEDERETSVYSGALEKDAIRDFVKAEKVPPYVIFSEENQDLIFNSGIPLNVIIIGSAEQLAKGSAVTKAARAAHSKTKGDVIFVLADRTGESAEPILEFFGLPRESEEPQVVGFHMESSQRYKFSEALSDATLTAFAEGIVAGTVEPSYKSEEVPTGDDAKDGDVVVVVGKNFDEIVLDEKRDVLLEAYAPWCGHCKQLAPTYRKLAKRFRDVDSVVIAKIEGTANEHKLLKVEGFPTILLFPAGKDQTPIPYEGDERTLKALTQFVKKSAKVDFTLPKKQKETEEQEDKEDEEAQKAAEAEEEEETVEGEDGGLPNDDDTQEIQLGDEDLVDGFEDLGDDVSEEEAAEAAAAAEEAVDAAEAASSEKDEL